tara:strand:+ start:729 stop:1460 length:732 start_codon:yes stop_codon:yes gene_type:complete
MSKKTLLNETQIRRFMKLADLGATQKFQSLREMGDYPGARDEMGDEELAPGGDLPPEPEDEDLPPVGDEGEGQELPPEAVSAVEAAVEAAVDAMGAELEKYGVQVDASRDGEEEMPGPEGDEMGGELEPAPPGGPEMGMGGEEELALQEDHGIKGHGPNTKAGKMDRTDIANKASGRWLKETEDDEDADTLEEEDISVIDDDEIVEQVAKRVAARLMRESRAKKRERRIDALAEKIASKLSRK